MVYLDTCLVIYWVENHTVFGPVVRKCAAEAAPMPIAISPLVMAEALVMPFRQKNDITTQKFKAFFESALVLPITEAVFIEAAHLRAAHIGLKMPDALHLACAKQQGCTEIWTNDDRLGKVAGSMAVNVLAGVRL